MELDELLIRESLHKAVQRYGLEGTEDKIKELYKLMPVCRDKMLEVFYEVYGVRGHKDSTKGKD